MAKLEGLTTDNLNKELVKAKAELESAQKDYEETLSEYKTLVSEKGQADSKVKEAKQKQMPPRLHLKRFKRNMRLKRKLMMLPLRSRNRHKTNLIR